MKASLLLLWERRKALPGSQRPAVHQLPCCPCTEPCQVSACSHPSLGSPGLGPPPDPHTWLPQARSLSPAPSGQFSAPHPAPAPRDNPRGDLSRPPGSLPGPRPAPCPPALLAPPALSSHGRRCSPPQPPLLALRQLRPLRQRRRQPYGRAKPLPRFENTNPTLRNPFPPPSSPGTGGRGG